nr:AAA family ATPase [Lactobacillus sp. ESL0703]
MSLFIKSVRVQGFEVEDAVVNFENGFNLIEGHSNHGKTMIVQFIEYAFGGRNGKDSLTLNIDTTRYNTVIVTLETDQGEISLSRNLKKNKNTVRVVSKDSRLLSGEYTSSSSNDKKMNIGIALLQLINVPTDLILPKNKKCDPGHVSFNVLKPLWLLNENDMPKAESVLIPSSGSGLFLSSLLYLLKGERIKTYDWSAVEKRRAVRDYISVQVEKVVSKKNHLNISNSKSETELQIELDNLTKQLNEMSGMVTEKVNQSKEYFRQMRDVNNELMTSDTTLSRYNSLKEQYASDIKRLSFIADGEVAFRNIEEPLLCPVCGQPVPNNEKDDGHIEAAKVELSRTISLLADLNQAIKDITENESSLKAQYLDLESNYKNIQTELSETLYPRLNEIKEAERSYREQVESISQSRILDNLLDDWTSRINELNAEGIPESNIKFNPKNELGDEFYDSMGKILNDFLEIGNYPRHHVATFGNASFDIMINGKKKAVSHGKGFRSYLNSITFMALSEYVNKNALFKPGFLIIDTPLEGLSEKDSDHPDDSMRYGIFELFKKLGNNYQTIVVENPDHLPKDFDFKKGNINVISYENDEGFLKKV